MARVICDMSMSLDGHVTGPNDSRENPFGDGAGMLHDWLSDAATDEDKALLQEMIDGVGAIVMGRTSFDKNEGDGGWGDGGPLGDIPCFVVTHHEPASSHPSIYAFVTDGVASAIEQAKEMADDRVVGLHGATVMQQGLPRAVPQSGSRLGSGSAPACTLDWLEPAALGSPSDQLARARLEMSLSGRRPHMLVDRHRIGRMSHA
jgi:dihydrofolate reductase